MTDVNNREAQTAGIAVEIKDLHLELGGIQILHGVNLKIRKAEITALIGPNGAGKTTMLLAILGVVPYRGEIIFNSGRRPRIGYVPQQFDFDRGMPVTVMDFLCLSRQARAVWISKVAGLEKRALATLARVDAGHLNNRKLGHLSGGELQRVLLALALLEEPEIILLDEPASAVDRSGEELFMNLIRELHVEQHMTFLMVSHDLSMVTRLAGQVICLNREILSEGGVGEVLTERNLSACFGADKGLLLHDHHWGAELSCAYDPAAEPKPDPEKSEAP